MPLVYQQNINETTKLGVWHIAEQENFFLQHVPLQRNITHPNKRLQHLAGRYLLKELYPGFPYELIRIADTRRPFLESEAYHFSISHSMDYAAVMVSTEDRVGVDIESISWKIEKVKHKFLGMSEMEMLNKIDASPVLSHEALLTAAWSIKESLFKWYSNGAVDFKEHLIIEKISLYGNEGVAHCRFLKDTIIDIRVHFLFFSNTCLSWVSGNILKVSR